MNKRKGIILAGGKGTRLYPSTKVISKQLLPVYDKPMIYYPLSTLMLAGMRDILIITTPEMSALFNDLIGNGEKWGINVTYASQSNANGIAQALIIAEDFLDGHSSSLILGDNIFFGHDLANIFEQADNITNGASVFIYHVNDARRYGVAEFNKQNQVISLEEKPIAPKSNYAVTGLYFYDKNAPEYAKTLQPSLRNEIEITDLNKIYLAQDKLFCSKLSRGVAWLDAGTHEDLNKASQYVETIESRQGLKIGCPEEIAFRNRWITDDDLEKIISHSGRNTYSEYLSTLISES